MANLTKDQCEALRRLKPKVVTIWGDEATDADAKLKTDKLSAYRKLSMTDDEIKAIDPTLLEE